MEGWGKVKQAARYAGVSERTFRDWLKQGLKFSQLPTGTILVRLSDIDSFLKQFSHDDHRVDRIVDEVMGGLEY